VTARTCGRKTDANRTICWHCYAILDDLLRRVPELLGELDVAITRQTRFTSSSGGSRSAEHPVPFNTGASAARVKVINDLTRWARDVLEYAPRPWTRKVAGLVAANVPHRLLAALLPWVAAQEAGPQLVEALTHRLRSAWATVDRPPQRAYAGPCPALRCPGTLYAVGSSDVARCDTCEHQGSAEAGRDAMRDRLDDRLFTATECERLTATLGDRVPANKIRAWASRGRLVSHPGPAGDPAYLLRDVLACAASTTRRKAAA
jgi:hypothetical protein